MKLGLLQTYQAILAIQQYTEEMEELEKTKEQLLNKGVLPSGRLKKIFIYSTLLIAVIFALLNFYLHGKQFWIFLMFPIHIFESLKWNLLILIMLFIYNRIRINVNKRRFEKSKYMGDFEYLTVNLETLDNALNHSVVPTEYRKYEYILPMVQSMQNEIVTNEEDAIKNFIYERKTKL
ncbi:hypothetical protein ABD87_00175 [Lysinibacillus sphaericus]|uniref:hypothetical protein n=1 Tax=Lysinibacillus sphaericus TaxID=1421 RepID=UPI0018CD5377|nr:hypothetical protein [Lysinibacillus sphaericus]MBG9728006.1 hypothetical protein [Lysinibacillus sphaericus]